MDLKTMHSLKPLIKYPGGKSGELETIISYLPSNISNYIEPFLGGGAVYFGLSAHSYYVNDISEELMLLYNFVKNQDGEFFAELSMINNNWIQLKSIALHYFAAFINLYKQYQIDDINVQNVEDQVANLVRGMNNELDRPLFSFEGIDSDVFNKQLNKNLLDKLKRIKRNEIRNNRQLDENGFFNNLETAFKSAYYMHFRDLYNKSKKVKTTTQRRVAIFFFVREYCFSSMFRFNRKGEFNVPYGGISYNKKTMSSKIKYLQSENVIAKLKITSLYNTDFETFLAHTPIANSDFMFLDPPYDTTFSDYDNNKFEHSDQMRLANYLINECKCRFMLIIKKTDFICGLYENKGLNIIELEKLYSVSFRNRNIRTVIHLLIKNY